MTGVFMAILISGVICVALVLWAGRGAPPNT